MDNQNTALANGDKKVTGVLILVLMDNQNTIIIVYRRLMQFVLILVLMDNQNTYIKWTLVRTYSLNPCSNG